MPMAPAGVPTLNSSLCGSTARMCGPPYLAASLGLPCSHSRASAFLAAGKAFCSSSTASSLSSMYRPSSIASRALPCATAAAGTAVVLNSPFFSTATRCINASTAVMSTMMSRTGRAAFISLAAASFTSAALLPLSACSPPLQTSNGFCLPSAEYCTHNRPHADACAFPAGNLSRACAPSDESNLGCPLAS